jgi:7-cyano-7-deazaguanine tRNA-ribosyltransferase
MSFEIRSKDLLGRIGSLRTRHGILETPLLLPVINPNSQVIPAKELRNIFGFDALITNSYLVWRRFRHEETVPNIHELLGFDGVIETDSGAYQILQYGDVEVQPKEIIQFQEKIDSDMAVILDVPTGSEASEKRARWTVDETLRRADEALGVITRRDILWVGPVQGGFYQNLVVYSAREMAKRDFSIYALGSPTPIMQQYRFDVLVDMIMAAKLNLPSHKPLHLFGAGHPVMFALAVALGCDIFDSASYALFARNGRYMTVQGTAKIEDLEYFPCNCPSCHNKSPDDIRKLIHADQERFLAAHNLHVCYNELQTIKQAIVDGRLWELVEVRARSHPALQLGLERMLTYSEDLEKETPVRKRKGPFIFDINSLKRPELIRHQEHLTNRYLAPIQAKSIILIPESELEPFREDPTQPSKLRRLEQRNDVHLCAYSLVFGIVPQELLDVYPLSQTESALSATPSAVNYAQKRIVDYLKTLSYKSCIIVVEKPWQLKIARSIETKFMRRMKVKIYESKKLDQESVSQILKAVEPRKHRFRTR